MKYQWISWHQPTEDYRPLTFPPNKAIIGWWCSGYHSDGTSILCALVKAGNADAAKAAVLQDWPEAEVWRFCVEKEDAMLSDRFPFTDWMLERLPC